MQRKIIHVDMDAFFASVEQRDDPSLRGRPVVVGGSDKRGVVAAASYEARRFGIHSAMPMFKARMRCKGLVIVPSRMDVYRAVSGQIREVFDEWTDVVEPLSLDEAYLDVTQNHRDEPSATRIAKAIKAEIRERTRLTASAGVSYNRFLAKMASGRIKPDGLYVVTPDMGAEFAADLPVGKFHGIGPSTAARMEEMGIRDGRDLAGRPIEFLVEHFGKKGAYYHDIARGIDDRPVDPDRVRKSVGAEDTFGENLRERDALATALSPVIDKAWFRCISAGFRGRKVTLKVKFSDFEIISRTKSLAVPVNDLETLRDVSFGILDSLYPLDRDVRLIGVSLSGSTTADPGPSSDQMTLDLG